MNFNELSPEQKYAFHKFVAGENIFITGPGGTGKSRLIKHFVQYSNNIDKQIDVCAMTGCAAILLQCNAKTIHSWSGIKLAKGDKKTIINRVLNNKTVLKTWRKAKVLVLDEVSMLSKKVFEIINEIGKSARHDIRPFGGIQIVFAGDFFQLPPIGTDGEPDTEMFCFESPIWNIVFKPENIIELTTMFRQRDPLYVEILSQIRRGYLDEEHKKVLQNYVGRKFDPASNNGCYVTKLFAIRSKTDYVNNTMFSQLDDKEYVYEVIKKKDCLTYLDSSKPIDASVLRNCSLVSEKDIEYEIDTMLGGLPCSQILRLKKGTAVMCTVNLDIDREICNGSQGVVIDIIEPKVAGAGGVAGGGSGPPLPVVRFSNGVVMTMHPHYWQSENIPTVCIGQLPLSLAWAMTIHKMQGTTLSMAEIDIGMSIFEYGQTYVALSRVQSLDGLYLSAFHAQKIKANPKVVEFYNNIVPKDLTKVVNDVSVGGNTGTGEVDFSDFAYNAKGGGVGGGGGGGHDIKVIKLQE